MDLVARLRAAGCVYAEDEAALIGAADLAPDELERLVAARVAGVPLEHLLGWAEFDGLRVRVDPGVFVPRRRTRLLAHEAALAAQRAGPGAVVVDLCCGSGAVAAAVVARTAGVAGVEVHATDSDPAAVACASGNLTPGRVHQGDLYDALPGHLRGRLAVVAANAPYVPRDGLLTMPPEARDHEPRTAHDGGPDGLDLHRRIVAQSADWLAPAGVLLLECAPGQVRAGLRILADAGFVADVVRRPTLAATALRAHRSRPD